jgi:hypothetical protein
MTVEEELSDENGPMSDRLHRLHYDRERALGDLHDRAAARGRLDADLELLARQEENLDRGRRLLLEEWRSAMFGVKLSLSSSG